MEGEAAYHQILFKDMDIFNIKTFFNKKELRVPGGFA